MKFYNVLEEIIPPLISLQLMNPSYQNFCHCECCQQKITIEVLNKSQPRYVTSDCQRDIVYKLYRGKTMSHLITAQITKAIYALGKSPGHNELSQKQTENRNILSDN